jgi:hypothetical protein
VTGAAGGSLRRALAALALLVAIAAGAAEDAVPPWRSELDAICARTQDAMALSPGDLRALVERCDRLAPELRRLGETERKVYGRRLEACRNLYAFVLETRERQ